MIVTYSGALTEAPRPPAWLSRDAKAEWKRVAPVLVQRRHLTQTDLGMVEGFCVAMGRVREIERELQKPGAVLDPRMVRLQDKALSTARQIAAEIGLTPVSRSRPAIIEDDDDNSTFVD
ncbi:phage terminase small subunit P27 family [Xanthobacter autotrophicus]|uniref:phage terminase small subunit P27 family n=1 Tax=Xanthobacter autotrophicus TaxID=280 RepID=UPI0037293AEA